MNVELVVVKSAWLMAVKVARYNEVFREYYLEKREEGFSYKKAIMSVAHKLIRVIFAMLTHKVYFSPRSIPYS
jgi:hypothetical protein